MKIKFDKTKRIISMMLSLVIIFSLFTYVPVSASGAATVSLDMIYDTAGVELQKKVDILLTKDDKTETQERSNAYEINSEEFLIAQYRERLASKGETYNSSRTEFEIKNQYTDDQGLLHVFVKEITYLTIAENGVETGYSAEHELIYEINNGKWHMIEDRQLEPTGLLPLRQAYQFVYDNNSNDMLSTVTEEPIVMANDPTEIVASIDRPDGVVIEKSMTRSGYNYSAMATYLETYWEDYNPAYRDFSNDGGDCTNFVSQALRAGGWEDKPGWYRSSENWWYNSLNQTWSWVNVDYLGSFARSSGRCTMLTNVWYLAKGDFLQVQPVNSSSKVHSMMVSYRADGVPYFTYHSTNRFRRSMNQVLEDWGTDALYYAYRT